MSNTSIASKIASRASGAGLAIVAALAFTVMAAPAEAGGRGHDRDWRDGRHHGRHYDKHRHHRKHYRGRDREVHHYYHGRPRVIYREAPPVVYHAPPRYYYGRPSVNVVLPLRF